MSSFSAILNDKLNNVYSFHIIVPEEIAERYQKQGIKRVLATLNNQETIHCGLLPLGNGERYILVNQQLRKRLEISPGEMVKVQLEEDTSEFGMALSEEFEEMLKQDEEGRFHFMKLTPGKQRNLIHWVGNVKSPHIRIRRAIVAFNHLKNQQGKLDFKLLGQEIKEANQMGL